MLPLSLEGIFGRKWWSFKRRDKTFKRPHFRESETRFKAEDPKAIKKKQRPSTISETLNHLIHHFMTPH